MKNYSKALSSGTDKPALGENMVRNSAGGFSYEISSQELLERFLLIGSEGGTYYVGEKELTEKTATSVVNLIKYEGNQVVATVVDFAVNSRAPKADAGIFVLALAATYGNEKVKQEAYSAISKVCRTSTHLFMFLANIKNLRGWSRGLRKGVAKFYTSKEAQQVAYQMVKYRNRAGYTHKDALRLSHPTPTNEEMGELFKYAVGKLEGKVTNSLVAAFEKAQASKDSKELVELIGESKLTWEMVPTEMLNNKEVLKALLPHMPVIALMRNLGRYSKNDLTAGKGNVASEIVAKLTDPEAVRKSGVHPINVVNAMMTYRSGKAQKGDSTWPVSQKIVDALAETFELSLKNVEETGKRILIGVDISGSMQASVGGMSLNAAQIAHVLALTILKTEKNADLVCFDTKIVPAKIGRRSSLDEAVKAATPGGGTDCSQPILHALKNEDAYDSIIIFTDNETWAGRNHGIDVLKEYRRKVNGNVKIVEVALESEGYSNMPANDKNILRVVGFDSSVTEVIATFLK